LHAAQRLTIGLNAHQVMPIRLKDRALPIEGKDEHRTIKERRIFLLSARLRNRVDPGRLNEGGRHNIDRGMLNRSCVLADKIISIP
jgi:hypothetical protein